MFEIKYFITSKVDFIWYLILGERIKLSFFVIKTFLREGRTELMTRFDIPSRLV